MRTEIEVAITLHQEWTDRMRHAVQSRSLLEGGEFVLARVQADYLCSFGKWLYGPTMSATVRESTSYQRVRALHADFHGVAAEVLMLAAAGNSDAAIAALEADFAESTRELVSALRDWQDEF